MYEGKKNVEKNIKKKKNITIFLIMILISAVSFIIIFKTDLFTVKYVKVYGNYKLSKKEVLNYSGITPGNNIFKEKVSNIKIGLLKNPYVKEVKISRKLPDKIIIHIIERKELAAIGFMDTFIVIDKDGMVLRSSENHGKLKVIRGLKFSNFLEGEKLKIKDQEQLDKSLQLIKNINSYKINIRELDVINKDNIRIMILENLICKIGPGNDLDYKLVTLKEILKDLKKKGIIRGVIDLSHKGYPSYIPKE